MPNTSTLEELGLLKVIAGLAGSVVSLRFVQGTWKEKALMVIGGAAFSIFATSPVAQYVGMSNAEGLVGFLIGLFGMAIASKVYELIQSVDPKQTVSLVFDRFLNRTPKE